MKARRDAATMHRMREQAWSDGYNGRPARQRDAAYQASWRRGREARAADKRGTA